MIELQQKHCNRKAPELQSNIATSTLGTPATVADKTLYDFETNLSNINKMQNNRDVVRKTAAEKHARTSTRREVQDNTGGKQAAHARNNNHKPLEQTSAGRCRNKKLQFTKTTVAPGLHLIAS